MALHVNIGLAHVTPDYVVDGRSRVVGTWEAVEDDSCIATGPPIVVGGALEVKSVQVVDFDDGLTARGA